jgi:hypothetical protein
LPLCNSFVLGTQFVKKQAASSTLKKVVVVLADSSAVPGYVNPSKLGKTEEFDLLTQDGEHREVALDEVRCVYFVREFTSNYTLERKAFLSRPKLDGLWVRLKFRDSETLEGVVPNDLLALLDSGVHITPPDMQGDTHRMFIPRAAITEMKVLGVVGVARRPRAVAAAASASAQPTLFNEE